MVHIATKVHELERVMLRLTGKRKNNGWANVLTFSMFKKLELRRHGVWLGLPGVDFS